MNNLWKFGAFKTAELIRKKEIKSEEAVSSNIERMKILKSDIDCQGLK